MGQDTSWDVVDLGVTGYQEAWDLQRQLVELRQHDLVGDLLLLTQHPHSFTFGRRATQGHLLWDDATCAQKDVRCYWVDRGGDVTYHGPGQLVGYPICNIRQRHLDVADGYIRGIERALVRALKELGVEAQQDPAYTGVWVGEEKIAAIGVKISRAVTSHGFALNIDPDLSYFQGIIPCGISGRSVTSVQRVLGAAPDWSAAQQEVVAAFVSEFGGAWRQTSLQRLLPEPASVGPVSYVS